MSIAFFVLRDMPPAEASFYRGSTETSTEIVEVYTTMLAHARAGLGKKL